MKKVLLIEKGKVIMQWLVSIITDLVELKAGENIYIVFLLGILFVVSLIPAIIILIAEFRPRDPRTRSKKIPAIHSEPPVPPEEEVKPKVMRAHA